MNLTRSSLIWLVVLAPGARVLDAHSELAGRANSSGWSGGWRRSSTWMACSTGSPTTQVASTPIGVLSPLNACPVTRRR